MKNIIKAIKDFFKMPEELFRKVEVYVLIRSDLKNLGPMVFSYDEQRLKETVKKYSLQGEVVKRELSFHAHNYLKKTVSELRFNECGDIITTAI